MRVSQEEKDKSHRRIVDSAAKLTRKLGIENTSVADVMGAAGLTNGGFYRHFETKEALVAAALTAAFDEIVGQIDARFEAAEPAVAMAGHRARYLSDGHVAKPEIGCPIAALGGDVARASDALKGAFGSGVDQVIARLAQGMEGSEPEKRAAAARELAMLAGAVMIARASDPETAAEMLAACRIGPAAL